MKSIEGNVRWIYSILLEFIICGKAQKFLIAIILGIYEFSRAITGLVSVFCVIFRAFVPVIFLMIKFYVHDVLINARSVYHL